MKAATELAARRDDDEAEGVHRLRDIVVEEVSLVDRAANKRRFLVVKRSDDMADDENAGAEIRSDGKDGLTTGDVEKAKKKPATGDEPIEEEKRKKPADDEDAEKARRRASDDEDDETEKARKPKDGDEEDAAKAKDADDEDDEEDEDPKAKAQKALVLPESMKESLLRALTDALERLMAVAGKTKDAQNARKSEDASLPEDLAAEVRAVAKLLEGAVGPATPTAKAEVVKTGARMAKDRLDRFQKAMTLLADILKELTGTKDDSPAPTAGAAESGVKKRDATASQPVPGLAELVAGIGELTRVVKRQEEGLGRIRQARGVSNAIPVDGARRREPEDVSWPMDMNRPISRDKVKKEVSFFDEE